MSELKNRLMRYAGAAAAVPGAAASAGVVYNDNANIVLGVHQAAVIDFGPAFGAPFRFELRGTSFASTAPRNTFTHTFTHTSYYSNSTTAYITTFTTQTRTYTGGTYKYVFDRNPLFQLVGGNGGFISNGFADPARLGSGVPVSALAAFQSMNTGAGTGYDIARKFTSFEVSYYGASTGSFTSYGSWNPTTRGYLGFRFFDGGNVHFGWFDVETRLGLSELVIHAWAFNDAPGAPIATGEVPAPAAGGLLALAMGAAGLRRTRKHAAVA